ncbi:GAF and ANTAR domain-containing protein [Umezawaea sp. Da 62-37]|uniref:GAF and ANTAR domain-containing protein n=1 Tax=Umezawaea sp. Da 62-37 TaxID=3075927 RepID=UPI0028F6FBCA|nr:GAF and ANTAR domain-containing protein [Umezawaea sp. Da 62-37]WNV85940.1 GAF and ANTAR domain-containing protein [Umezawaea sp. Da 62-37]
MTEQDGSGDLMTDQLVRQLDEVTGALERLSQTLDQDEDLDVILHRVCLQAIHAIPEADMASVTMVGDGTPKTAAVSHDHATHLDGHQYRSGQGPCLESAQTRKVVRISIADAHHRWPAFAASAADSGVASYLSAPLFIDTEYHGSLNLYGEQPHGFHALDAALLELYTTAAEAALRAARRYRQSMDHITQLKNALTSRATIDQAKGILMAVRRVDAEQAFTLLVQQSQRENIKLRDLATRFITTAAEPTT